MSAMNFYKDDGSADIRPLGFFRNILACFVLWAGYTLGRALLPSDLRQVMDHDRYMHEEFVRDFREWHFFKHYWSNVYFPWNT